MLTINATSIATTRPTVSPMPNSAFWKIAQTTKIASGSALIHLAPVELDALAVASALCLVDFGFHIAVARAGRRTAGTGTH
jgi:hypothetical protein